MKFICAALTFMMALSARAGVFNCRIEENFSDVKKVKITIGDNQKALVRSDYGYSFYLNTFAEKNIELEVFLPEVEMRIYAKGNAEKTSVKLTSWLRSGLLEFQCVSEDNKAF